MPRDKVGKFTVELNPRDGFGTVEWQLVDQFGEGHRLGLVVEIKPPHGIGNRFLTEVCFLGQRAFVEIQQGCPDDEIVVYLIVYMHTHHGLGLQVKGGVVFKRNAYRGS